MVFPKQITNGKRRWLNNDYLDPDITPYYI